MSLIEALSRLREELPLDRRSAPKRALLQHHLVHEHALLQQPSAAQTVSENLPGHGRTLQTEGTADPCSPQEQLNTAVRHRNTSDNGRNPILIPPRSKVVEVMFRKARLRRCFMHIIQQQQGRDEHRKQFSATSQSGLGLQRQGIEHLDALVEETSKEVESAISPESAEPPQLVELHPSPPESIIEPRLPERAVPAEVSPPHGDESDDEAERAQRRILLRRFFQAARRRDLAHGGDRLDLGEGGAPAAAGGAPCFTVGSSRGRSTTSTTRRGHEGNSFGGPGGVRLRRADLLRRILHAMRESARERVLEADASTAPPSPASQDFLPRPPSLLTSQQLPLRNEVPPAPPGPHLTSPPSPRGDVPADTAAARRDLPVHPRQAARAGNAYQAVLEALTRLLPQSTDGESQSGRPCGGAGARVRVGTMQAAAIRCGIQCQEYIRALQKGIEVVRSGIRSKLILEAASADGTGVALALHDLDVSPEAAVAAAAAGGAVASCPPGAPAFVRLPLAHVTRVRCLAASTGGESNRFVILAAGTFGGVRVEDKTRSQETVQPLVAGEGEPFGILRAVSDEDFCALVLGVASVKSALGSPFRTRQATNVGTRGYQPPRVNPTSSVISEPPPTTPAAIAAAAAATACLPWQGARVCIVELAPSLTFFGAVSAVEAEARRVGRENGLTLTDQNLLICTGVQ